MKDALLTVLIALPWLYPFAPGPSPAVVPWLISFGAVAALLFSASVFGGSAGAPEHDVKARWARPAATAWLLAGLVNSVIAMLQYFGMAEVFSSLVSQTELGEAFGNLRQRNHLASLTNISLAALVWFAATGDRSRDRAGRLAGHIRWLLMVAAALVAIGNAASSSRTGLVELGLLCILAWIWGAWRDPRVRSLLLTAAFVYGAATLALPVLAGFDWSGHGVFARLRTGDQVCSSRLTLWANVLQLIAAKPWFGWGWGELAYAHYTTLYGGPRFCDILDNAHNLPLHLAATLGIPVALAASAGFFWWVGRQRPWREPDPTRQLAWSVLAIILLHSLLEYPLWYGTFQTAAGLCVILLWPRPGNSAPRAGDRRHWIGPLRVSSAAVATAFAAICAYGAWDYHRISQLYLAPAKRDEAYRDDTLEKARNSWLFDDQVRFAELTTTPLTRDTAQWTFDTATGLLHYSPEPRVIEKLIGSAVMLGLDDEAMAHLARYRAAFPSDHARWIENNG